jgi:hypothetical protein
VIRDQFLTFDGNGEAQGSNCGLYFSHTDGLTLERTSKQARFTRLVP